MQRRKTGLPARWTVQSFKFELDPTDETAVLIRRHVGMRRKAHNWAVAHMTDQTMLDRRRADADMELPEMRPVKHRKVDPLFTLRGLRKFWNRRKNKLCVDVETGEVWWRELSKEAAANGIGLCPGNELYAEAAHMLVPSRHNYFTYYWHGCNHLPSRVTPEAIKVVEDAFAGRTPQWFYNTFEKTDGSLDYEMLWTAVRNMLRDNDRIVVVHQLRNEFGGYCSEQAAKDSAFGDLQLAQPWRDGGCTTDS